MPSIQQYESDDVSEVRGPETRQPETRQAQLRSEMNTPQEMSKEDFQSWLNASPKKGRTSVSNSDRNIAPEISKDELGMIVPRKHPELPELYKDFDVFSVPHKGFEDKVLVRPRVKPALVG
jgi:hypothetical protein